MSNIRITICLILAGLLTFSGLPSQRAEAQFFGPQIVFDPAAVAEAIKEVAQGAEQIRLALEDLENQARQLEAMTGRRDIARQYLEPRGYLPDDLAELLRTEIVGNEDVLQLVEELDRLYLPVNSDALVVRGIVQEDSPFAMSIDRATNANLAALASSQMTYNQVRTRLESIDGLLGSLEGSEDLKTSIDLNARIAAENSLLLAELIRMQALDQQARASSVTAEQTRRTIATRLTTVDREERARARAILGMTEN